MGTDVDGFLRGLARRLKPRADLLTEALDQRFRSALPDLWEFEDIAASGPAATSEHVSAVLDALEHGAAAAEYTAPPAAVEFSRLLARHGVPISVNLHGYRLGHAGLLELLYEEATRLTGDLELLHAAMLKLNALGFEYADRTAEKAVTAYQEERDRWLQRRLMTINEASRRIGTSLDVVRTAQDLVEVGTECFADLVTVDLLDAALQEEGTEPAVGSPVMRRVAQQSIAGGLLSSAIDSGQTHVYPAGTLAAHALATGQPRRCRTSQDEASAWLAAAPEVEDAFSLSNLHSLLLVPLWARGAPLGLAQFFRHRIAGPFNDDDLLLAQEIAARAAVGIDHARRYTHERSTAITLQRSLLPRHAPEQSAVATASRYLPSGARAGVGGDWYDVIPLSGGRVALVIGDVVGRGLHASATMGRLRTAVRTLADIDLMPDELLTHLDDVVIRLQREEGRDGDETSATCLYAVYDPISCQCSLASAGHPLPAVVAPQTARGGDSCAVDFPQAPIGPPLGLGGLPFEAAQFELPVGSSLVLFTDGLVEDRKRDVDTGLALMRDVLARAPASLEDTCDRLLSALRPRRATDDIALLIARTRALDADHVASWDFPSDPTVVSEARASASRQLVSWGLDELAFSTELIVSELVTNAIRYGKEPIRLRMILQSTLTCEVSDGSNTAPHLRRARTCDEGGRGLLLVAQLAEHWGTRHGREGKTIWAEQPLPTG